jgi:hypothetical protein
MATTTNYAWTTPDNSGLVKNGAQDIRTLGSSVDTALWNVGYGQAGKNKIINGDMNIWQRGTSFTITGASAYTADRFQVDSGAAQTVTVTQEAFTAGTAPVAGYEGQYFIRLAYGGASNTTTIRQYIEDVRTLAGQPATLSFWAKVSSGTKSATPRFVQNFGSGGSGAVVTNGSAITLTTSWQRFSVSVNVPSIAGKTIGAGSNLHIDCVLDPASLTYDFWGMQVEYGSKATPFETATGTIQGELAACQRYYYRFTPTATSRIGVGYSDSTTFANINVVFPVQMRVAPTALEQSGTATDYSVANNVVTVCNAVPVIGSSNVQSMNLSLQVAAGLVAGEAVQARLVGTAGYLGWSAEL